MNKLYKLAGLSALLLLAGCTTSIEAPSQLETVPAIDEKVEGEIISEGIKNLYAETKVYPELEALIIKEYDIPEEFWSRTRYYYNYVDLNSDGKNEIFVVVMGPYTSGSGGSSALIVHPIDDELNVNQQFSLVRTPVIISDTSTNGSKEIIALRSGGGVESSYVKLTCSDGYYTNVSDGKEINNLDNITGTAIIANDIVEDLDNGVAITLGN